jgi:integrase
MESKSVWNAVHEAAKRAGLDKHVHPHTLRHYAEFRTMPSKLAGTLIFRQFQRTGLGIVGAGSSQGCWSNGNSIRLLL